MTHAYHQLPRVVLGDDCEECRRRASDIEGLASLDAGNLRLLGELANDLAVGRPRPDASTADMRAVENLRLAARIVYESGITEEAAR